MFLTEKEVSDLTGYKQPSKQVEMLRRQGIPFHVNAAGHPKIARAIIEGKTAKPEPTQKTWTPSWAAIHQ
jgi:hypothetical protein